MKKYQQRCFSGEPDKYAMASLAQRATADYLYMVDLPSKLSSWTLDDPDNIGLWFDEEGRLASRQDYVFGVVIFFLYYFLQKTWYGRTIGKLIAGTCVVREDGSRISFGQELIRTLCRFIPLEPFSFFGGHGHLVGWHDRIAKTKVSEAKGEYLSLEISKTKLRFPKIEKLGLVCLGSMMG